MPRVGSSRISTSHSEHSHLARMTFCWVPPLRKRTFFSVVGVAMRSLSINSFVAFFSRPTLMMPAGWSFFRLACTTFSRMDISTVAPS